MDALKNMDIQQFVDRIQIPPGVTTVLFSCTVQVVFFGGFFISYIPTAIETLNRNPDKWIYVVGNIFLKLFPLFVYLAILFHSWKKNKKWLALWTGMAVLFFLLRIILLVKDLFFRYDVGYAIVAQLPAEFITIGILVPYLMVLWKRPVAEPAGTELREGTRFLGIQEEID